MTYELGTLYILECVNLCAQFFDENAHLPV